MSGLTELVEPARDMDIREPKLPRLGSERRWASSDSLEPAERIPTQLHSTINDTNTSYQSSPLVPIRPSGTSGTIAYPLSESGG